MSSRIVDSKPTEKEEFENLFGKFIDLLKVAGSSPAAVGFGLYLLTEGLSRFGGTTTTVNTPPPQPSNPLTQAEQQLLTDIKNLLFTPGPGLTSQPFSPIQMIYQAIAASATMRGQGGGFLTLADSLALKGALTIYISTGGNLAGVLSGGANVISALGALVPK